MKKAFLLLSLALFFLTFHASAQKLVILAGTGTPGYNGDSIQATAAQLSNPVGIAFDAHGNIYIADGDNNRVRKIDSAGVITTVAGTGAYGYTGDSGLAVNATITFPVGLAFDSRGNLYVTDGGNNVIRKIDTAGIITTLVKGVLAPSGLAFDTKGNLFITEQNRNTIVKVDTLGNIATIAGTGIRGDSGDHGPAIAAKLNTPYGICFDAKGNLYFTESLTGEVRKIDTAGIITTIAGTGTNGYNGDGITDTIAELNDPQGIAFDKQGDLYIADGANNRIRKVDTSGIITTFVGKGGYINDSVNFESALAFDAYGNLYLIDAYEDYVREIFPVASFSGSPVSICSGNSVSFTNLSSKNTTYQWSFPGGTPDTSTLLNPPNIIYTASGRHNVQLIAGAGNARDTMLLSNYITVSPSPVAGTITTPGDTICPNTIATLDLIGSSGNIQWQSANSTGSFSNINGATSTNYSGLLAHTTLFRVIASINTCTDTAATKTIVTIAPPTASFTFSINALTVSFYSTVSAGVTGYSWNFGDSSATSTEANPVHVYAHNVNYDVCLTVTNKSNCNYTVCQNLNNYPYGVNMVTASSEQLTVYPDPFSNEININITGNEEIKDVTVYDVLGRTLLYKNCGNECEKPLQLEAAGLPDGIYFLSINTYKSRFVQKIIKE